MKRIVSVAGPAHCSEHQAELAERVGALLAEHDVILACGGRGGVMEAACKGAVTSGGTALGILPGSDASLGNPYLTIALPTGLGEARNAVVATVGAAVIAIGGELGTLSEIAHALKAGRRVIGLDTWSAQNSEGKAVEIVLAKTPEEAVALALEGAVD